MDVDQIRRSLKYYGTWMQIIANVQSDLDDALILRGNANCCDQIRQIRCIWEQNFDKFNFKLENITVLVNVRSIRTMTKCCDSRFCWIFTLRADFHAGSIAAWTRFYWQVLAFFDWSNERLLWAIFTLSECESELESEVCHRIYVHSTSLVILSGSGISLGHSL